MLKPFKSGRTAHPVRYWKALGWVSGGVVSQSVQMAKLHRRSPTLYFVLVVVTAGLFVPVWFYLLCRDVNHRSQRTVYDLRVVAVACIVLLTLILGWIAVLTALGVTAPRLGLLIRTLVRYEILVWLLFIPLAISLQRRIARGLNRKPAVGDAVGIAVMAFIWMACLPYLQAKLNGWICPAAPLQTSKSPSEA